MARDPALAFSQNLIESYIRFKLAERQFDLFERREKRYSASLLANQRFAQEGRRIQQEQFQQTLGVRQKEAEATTAFRTRTAERLEDTAESLEQYREEQMLATQGRFEAGQAFAKEDPRREFGAAKLAFIRDPATTPEQRASVLGGGTTIVMPGETQRSTIGKMEDDIRELNQGIFGLQTVSDLYKDEYSTYPFKARKYATAFGEKIGIEAPEEETFFRASKKQLADYSSWFGVAEEQFLVFRKWATGVAGGPAEMQQIRTAFPDPKDKSPTEFKSMLEQAIQFRKAYKLELSKQIMSGTMITPELKSKILMSTLNQVQLGRPAFRPEAESNRDPLGLFK